MSIFKRIIERLKKVKKKFTYTLIFVVMLVMGTTIIITVRSVVNQRKERVREIEDE
jgi:competence protein ComGC